VLAALKEALLVSRLWVLNTGPLPEVLGADSFTPLRFMHAANAVSALRKAGVPNRRRAACPLGLAVPPNLFFGAVRVGVEEEVVAALALVLLLAVLLLDESPQADRIRQASTRIRAVPAMGGLRM